MRRLFKLLKFAVFCTETRLQPNTMKVLELMQERKRAEIKSFALLIDPDNVTLQGVKTQVCGAEEAGVHYIFLGGSLVVSDWLDELILEIKRNCSLPVVLFPGSISQISKEADAIFFLSLISGRNPELLIGTHVLAAPLLKKAGIEIIPTGYMLVDSGRQTTASYMSQTQPIPHDKDGIAKCTAMAGEMLGLRVIYMDGGSGAQKSISTSMIYEVSEHIDIPLIVGGGIRSKSQALEILRSGADIIVVGNALESNPGDSLLKELAEAALEASANKI